MTDAGESPQGPKLSILTPMRRDSKQQGQRLRRGAYLLPSAFTMANLFCGYACIVHTMHREFHTAALFIGVAIVLDMLDGRVARLTGTTSAFGLEFDSLADVVSFGVAPAILSFGWGLQPLGRLGWAAGFLFVAAAAVRLARFNIQAGSQDKRYFVGMPSPPAAGVPAATVFAFPAGFAGPWEAAAVLTIVIVPALLMVSTIRFRSFKTLDLKTRRSSPMLFLLALALAALAAQPEIVLLVMAYGYLSSAFIGLAWQRWRRRREPPAPSDVSGQADPAAQAGQQGA